MTSDGHVTTISRETDEETFRALGVSLGALGVIVAVTVQCDKAFRLLVKQFPSTRTQVPLACLQLIIDIDYMDC